MQVDEGIVGLKGKSYAYKGRWNYYAVDPNGHYKLNTN